MLYIVRHGQTNWNTLNKRQGHTNIPLNETGIKQAKKLKDELKNIKFDYVISSPLDRAIQTAKIISGKDPLIDERLIERNNGKLEGLTGDEIAKVQKQENYSDELYEVETISDLQKRAEDFIKEILAKYPGKDILIVTHVGLIMNIRCYLDGEPDDISNYVLGNCEVYKYKN